MHRLVMNTAPRPTAVPVHNTPKPAENALVGVVVVRDQAGLAEHLPAWQELAETAVEPNAFQEPWLLLPALAAFGAGLAIRFVFVYGPTNPPSKKRVLLGFFPLLPPRRIAPLVPGGLVESWRHIYSFSTTPLLHAKRGGEALHALLDWLAKDRDGGALWRMEHVAAEGPFARLLTEVLNQRHRPSFVVESYSRAALEVGSDADAYLQAALPHKRYKEYRRQHRLLGERGELQRRVLSDAAEVDAWTEAFLDLEAAGWKGQEGTAMKARPVDAEFFRAIVRGAFARGRLLMLGLFLDGRAIALKCNLLAPPGAFAFKIAFDESYAAHSPGVLLEFANVEYLHEARPVRWMDSCAVRDHFMINRLWRERRAVQTLLVATGRAPGDLIVALSPLARWLKRKFRRSAPKVASGAEERT